MKELRLIIAMIILALSVSNATAFTSDGTEVKLQVQMVLASGGSLINGERDITVRLKAPENNTVKVIWEKDYTAVTLTNGALLLELKGEDKNNNKLIASMFDAAGIFLEVQISDQVVTLDLVSQPFAIKSRISDESHSTKKLQGIPLRKVTSVKDGDLLVAKNGEWVPSSVADGYTGVASQNNRITSLKQLDDTEFKGLDQNQIIGYNGTKWVNVEDQKLSEADVDAIVSEKGYLKTVGKALVPEGEYDQIKGIGGNIKTSPNIALNAAVNVQGPLAVGGTIGVLGTPISKVFAKEIGIVSSNQVVLTEENNKLNVNVPVTVTGKSGVLLSGVGKAGKVAVFSSQEELTFDDSLIWDSSKKQLALGATSSLAGIKFNVEGNLRVSNKLIVGTEELSLAEYIKASQLASVATTGAYSDITGVPSLNLYVLKTELNTSLSDSYKKSEANAEIDRRINLFKSGTLQTEFTSKLSTYETSTKRDEKVTQALADYYTKTQADAEFINSSEMTTALGSYATETKIKNDLLSEYIKSTAVHQLGKTGQWADILGKPALVSTNTFEAYKTTVSTDFATKTLLNSELASKIQAATADVFVKVAQQYVSKTDLTGEGFAKVVSLNALKEVARSGAYNDLTGKPDLTVYMNKTDIESKFIDGGELTTSLSAYLKDADVKTVAKTGAYADLTGEPDMSLYQLIANMNGYVTTTNLLNELSDVVRTGSGSTIDLSPYEKTADLTTKLSEYPKSNTLHKVATSGKFVDLIGTSNVIISSQLTSTLVPYVTTSNIQDTLAVLEAKFYDSTELLASFNALQTDITSARTTALADYYTKTAADTKIDQEITSFNTNVNVPAIDAKLLAKVSTTDLNTTLDNYKTDAEIQSYVTTQLNGYVTATSLDTLLNSAYVSKNELQSLTFLRYQEDAYGDDFLSLDSGPVLVTGHVEVTGDVNINGTLTTKLLNVSEGIQSPAIKDGAIALVDMAEDSINSVKIVDGSILNADVNNSAAIAFSKLNISAANIRGLTPYSGGTGLSITNEGILAIGQGVAQTDDVTFKTLEITSIETNASPHVKVAGTIRANKFQGDGSQLTNINVENISGQIDASTVSGALKANQIENNAIKTNHIYNGTIETEDLKDAAVTNAKLAGSIAFDKLSMTGTNIRSKNPYSTGTGVSMDGSGVISIGQAVGNSNSPQFAGLKVKSGTTTMMEVTTAKTSVGALEAGNTNVNGKLGVGVASPTKKLEVNGDVQATNYYGNGATLSNIPEVPQGVIVMWSGGINDIPKGWHLCDGTTMPGTSDNSPNLKGRFIVGYDPSASSYNQIGKTGGVQSNTIAEANMPQHNHTVTINDKETEHNHTGSSDNQNLQHRHYTTGTSANQNANHNHNSGNQSANHHHRINISGRDDNNHTGNFNGVADSDAGEKNFDRTTHNQSHNHNHHIYNNNSNHGHNISLYSDNRLGNHSHTLTINNKKFTHNHTGTVSNHGQASPTALDNRPPFYTLAFIVKCPINKCL